MSGLIGLIVGWLVSAAVLIVVDRLDIGLRVGGLANAVLAAIVIAVLDWLVGGLLRLLALPLQILCLGLLSWLIAWLINAAVLYLAAKVTPGFRIAHYRAALLAALVISVLNWGIDWIARTFLG